MKVDKPKISKGTLLRVTLKTESATRDFVALLLLLGAVFTTR